MRTESSFHRQLPRKFSRDGPNSLANVVYDPFDEGRVVSLGHHSNERLGTRFADDQPATAFEFSFRSRDSLSHAVGLERLCAAVEPNVLQELRKRLELPQKFTCGQACLDQSRQDLQTRNQAVAGSRVI